MLAKVLRPIQSGVGDIKPGAIVDTTNWQHRNYHLGRGAIRALNEEEIDAYRAQRKQPQQVSQKGDRR